MLLQLLPRASRCTFSLAPKRLNLKCSLQHRTYTKDTVTGGKLVPQLDIKYILKNVDQISQNAQDRNVNVNVPRVVSLIDSWNTLKKNTEINRRERNELADKLKDRNLSVAQRNELIQLGKAKRDAGVTLEQKTEQAYEAVLKEALRLPNATHPEAPRKNARVLKVCGTKPRFSFPPKSHLQLGELHQMIDFESGAKVTGAKFYFLKNDGAMLELALVNWTMRKLVERGWTPVITPDLARTTILEGIGFQPRGAHSQIYSIADHDTALVGTAEVTLGGMYADQLVPVEKLPIRMVGLSHCFRTEVGEAGKEVRGLYRVHQFTKVEMFALTTPEESEKLHQEILDIEVDLLNELGLHFKVFDMPTEELGAPAYRKYDIEAYMPFKDDFGEVTSASNCTDYQSRRLNIRCQYSPGNNVPLHTLNGTACAVPRWMLAIMECNQQEDGSIVIPKPLVPFMGKEKIVLPQKKEKEKKK